MRPVGVDGGGLRVGAVSSGGNVGVCCVCSGASNASAHRVRRRKRREAAERRGGGAPGLADVSEMIGGLGCALVAIDWIDQSVGLGTNRMRAASSNARMEAAATDTDRRRHLINQSSTPPA